MSKAQELAKEIADDLYKFGWIDQRWVNIYSQVNLERHLERVIAAKLEPLVSDAERYHKLRAWAMEDDQESEATNEH